MKKIFPKYILLFLILRLFYFLDFSFAQDTLPRPVTIFLNDKPAPQTEIIPLTQAQSQGKKHIFYWGRDTIEQTKEIPLAPLQTTFLPVLKNKKGEPVKPRPAHNCFTECENK